MPNIHIQVSGDPGSGKSVVVQTIANILAEHGFIVGVTGTVTMRDVEKLSMARKSVAERTIVGLREIHVGQPPTSSSKPSTNIKGSDT